MGKEIILDLRSASGTWAEEILRVAAEGGVHGLLMEASAVPVEMRRKFTIFGSTADADIQLLDLTRARQDPPSRPFGVVAKVDGADDMDGIAAVARRGAKAVFVETPDWRIIPLENLIADLAKSETRLYARAAELGEVETLFGILERGVSGVVYRPKTADELRQLATLLRTPTLGPLRTASIAEIVDVGMGDRVCIDTVSMLSLGQGALVGSKSSFLFLVHNESVGSEFTAARPFRVNAGAVHCYVLVPGEKTKYLSELQSGDRVLIANPRGEIVITAIGRCKIERRPMRLLRAHINGEEGGVVLQNAETVRLVQPDGSLLAVTAAKPGDRVLVHIAEAAARHFGTAVDEFILER